MIVVHGASRKPMIGSSGESKVAAQRAMSKSHHRNMTTRGPKMSAKMARHTGEGLRQTG